jgi:hypothetical protein
MLSSMHFDYLCFTAFPFPAISFREDFCEGIKILLIVVQKNGKVIKVVNLESSKKRKFA